jgi:hypothetical protein
MGEEVGTMQFRVQGKQIKKGTEKEKKIWVYKICMRKEKNISMYDINKIKWTPQFSKVH